MFLIRPYLQYIWNILQQEDDEEELAILHDMADADCRDEGEHDVADEE